MSNVRARETTHAIDGGCGGARVQLTGLAGNKPKMREHCSAHDGIAVSVRAVP